MLQYGIITPSVSPYASPITLVTKRDKTKRFCIDYRKLNEIIAPDVHPLPLIETILDKLSKAKYYSSVDIASAYWQVEIEPNSRNLLAFVTLDSQYEFCRLPYGFKNSPQIYHRHAKYKLNFVTHYFDDFIIFSDTLEDHLQHLQQFLTVCQHENITLNYNKCSFFKTNIDFLGYTVTAGTYAPQTRNLDTINAIKPPTNQKTLQSFLGAVNVYNKFIADYARLRTPLNKLLKKDVKWNWDQDCQQAFTTLKESLTSKPVLHLYQVGLPCRLYCDASTQGIAGILKQVHPDGQVHPVQYFSRALRAHERNYTVSELECLAIVESVDKFRIYLTDTIAGFSKYGHSKTYLHVIVDHLTRYAWTFPSKSTSTLTYIQTLKTVLQQGFPKRLLSDRAPAFTSEKFRKFLITHGIQPLLTTSNNPQANGLIERLNATITGKLRLAYLENPKASWTQLVKRVTQTYNNTPHSVTSFPPTYLMFNVVPPDLRTHINPYPEINIAREIARTRTQNKHKKDKETFDKQHRTPHFEVNDLVLVKNYRHPDTGKLAPYFTGPYKIIEIISPNVVRIDRPNQPLNRDSDTIHGLQGQSPNSQPLITCSRRFIRNYADIARPLNALLSKGTKFEWNTAQEGAFRKLKIALTSKPVLGHFDDDAPTELHTDASGYGIGAVLAQNQGGGEKVIAYASRTLLRAEQNYSTTERECLAIIWAIGEFRPYLFGRHFRVPIPPPDSPFQKVGIDLLGRFPISQGKKKWMVVCTDYLTKYVVTQSLGSGEAQEIAKFLLEEVILKHGAPREIVMDRGRNFQSKLLQELTNKCGIKKKATTAYHPQTNGLTERLNRTIADMLSIRTGTRCCPLSRFLQYGQTRIDWLHAILPDSWKGGRDDPQHYLPLQAEEARQIARHHTFKAQETNKTNYEARHTGKIYEPGDLVWILIPIRHVGFSEKLLRQYFDPFRVTKKISDVTYEVEAVSEQGRRQKKRDTVHILRMKPYYDPSRQEDSSSVDNSTSGEEEELR
ncbi:hypothetical protein LAZ67_11001834 [Cordylochernes scorpioides]|uniref:Uncharacterized protein n=1 Tax=Cordylochernes scorpioides TaxID=51811 RepID=A0ABY6KZF3_9ARAC|nr:hypothetical protein LAZ67_11001834 [Cordylochernes scorpioides]